MGNLYITIFDIKNREKRRKQKLPNTFPEQELAMLIGIINSDKAIYINIAI